MRAARPCHGTHSVHAESDPVNAGKGEIENWVDNFVWQFATRREHGSVRLSYAQVSVGVSVGILVARFRTVPIRPTILLVDDDLDLREAAAEALEDAGYKVVRADDGRRALDEMSRGLRPDLILLDMMMPNLDGWGFRVAQKQMPDIAAIPVVALTAYALTEDERNQLDAAEILRKPVALEELMRAVEGVARSTT